MPNLIYQHEMFNTPAWTPLAPMAAYGAPDGPYAPYSPTTTPPALLAPPQPQPAPALLQERYGPYEDPFGELESGGYGTGAQEAQLGYTDFGYDALIDPFGNQRGSGDFWADLKEDTGAVVDGLVSIPGTIGGLTGALGAYQQNQMLGPMGYQQVSYPSAILSSVTGGLLGTSAEDQAMKELERQAEIERAAWETMSPTQTGYQAALNAASTTPALLAEPTQAGWAQMDPWGDPEFVGGGIEPDVGGLYGIY